MPRPSLTPPPTDRSASIVAPPRPAPGLFGKLPATGDFVSRGLPRALADWLDALAARHLGPCLTRPLAFRLTAAPGPLSGIASPSRDRSGRPFPLALAAAAAPAPAAPWFDALAALAADATAAALDADILAARLAALPAPPDDPDPTPLLLWIPGHPPRPADPEAPGAALDALLAEVG